VLAPEVGVILESNPSRARDIARQFLTFYLKAPNYTNNFLREGFTSDDLLNGGSDRLIDAIITWGDPPTIRARLNDHYTAGASHLALQVLGGDRQTLPLAQLRDLASMLSVSA
jgi:probable F420-dependent oxidoreductase